MTKARPRIVLNAVANLVGSLAIAVVNLAVVPSYMRLLGMDSFGLIGVSATIGLILGLSDFGLAPTLTRELAREWKDEADIAQGRTTLETLHRVYLPLALLLGGIVVVAAPVLASSWFSSDSLPETTVAQCVRLIGVSASGQLLVTFYLAGLNGLQRQVLANVFAVLLVGLQAGGAILLLTVFDASVLGFFMWQAGVLAAAAVALGVTLFALVPGRGIGRGYERSTLRAVQPFALGMFGISLLSIVVTQTDKAYLSRVLDLDEFGLYSLATMVALSLRRLFGPLFSAAYPRFTELVRSGDSAELARAYRLVSQAMTVIVIPASLVLLFYPSAAVFLWTGDLKVAEQVAPIVAVLIGGVALTGVTQTPYAMQLAHGWTRLALLVNLGAALLFVPAVLLLGHQYGALGVALAVLGLNVVYLLVQTPLMHRRILPRGFASWALRDTLAPSVAAVIPIAALHPAVGVVAGSRIATGSVLAAAYLLSVGCAFAAASDLRRIVGERLRRN